MHRLKYLISTLGGFQFGYSIGIMAGAILFLIPQFSLTPQQQSILMSVFLMGAIPGAAVAGPLSNRFGRKSVQMAIAFLFFLGSVLLFFASSVSLLILGRILQGVAGGSIAVVGPLYLAEVAPTAKRGVYVGFYQLAVTTGILVAYGINLVFAKTGEWHWMFGLGMIPAILHFIGFGYLPDSQGQKNVYLSWTELLKPPYRFTLLIAILLNVFQQVTGINAILYFAPIIFLSCGFNTPTFALIPPLLIGFFNVAFTVVSLRFLDKKGRRPLLLLGVGAMAFSLAALVVSYLVGIAAMKWVATSSILVYIASFAIGLGPTPQLVVSELFPRKVRGQALSISMFSNWIFNLIVVFTFLDFTSRFSHAGTFAIYGVFAVIAFYIVWRYVPETKGSALD